MVFVGAMDWLPNVDGVNFFLGEVLPRIRRLVPRAELWVVGRNPSASRLRTYAGDGVRVTGTVDDVRPYLARASLVVVPLRIGGGTRLKILEAWAMRKAVLSTVVGAEGLPAVDGENIALADTPEGMAARAVALLTDAKGAARLGTGGRRVVEEHFSWKRVANRLLEAYDETVQGARRRAGTPWGHGRIAGLAAGSRVGQFEGRQ
jgi:glycosyltransferase involved in cell wall biosynthesis